MTNNNIESSAYLSGWKRAAFLTTLVLVSIFSQVDRILPFILGESIKKELGLSDTQLGLITGLAFAVCYSLAALPLARISDRGGAGKVLVWCVVVWSAMTGLAGLASGFLMLSLLRVGVALGEAGGTPASHALIVQKIPASFRGRAIGLFSMGIPLGTMLGFALGGWAGDRIGWRSTFMAAGALGLGIALLVTMLVAKRSNGQVLNKARMEGFIAPARNLLKKPAFLWLFISANLVGFASAPFYVFTSPFLIRTYGLSTSEVGLKFGLLQGLMGIVATLVGGRLFDRAVANNSVKIIHQPAIVFMVAAVCTTAALFMPSANLAIALLVPGMFSFAFALPFAFGVGHLIAGTGKQAFSSSMLLLGTSLVGPALAPLLVGAISDYATGANIENGLRWGLLIGPAACILCALACFQVSKKMSPRQHLHLITL